MDIEWLQKATWKSRDFGLGQNSALLTHSVVGRSVSGRGGEKIARTLGEYAQSRQKSLSRSLWQTNQSMEVVRKMKAEGWSFVLSD